MRPFILLLAVLSTTIACKTGAKLAKTDPFIGNWTMEVSGTPEGTITSDLMVTKEGDIYKAVLKSHAGTVNSKNVTVVDQQMTMEAYIDSYDFDMTMIVTLDESKSKFSGSINNMFDVTGTRVTQ